MAELRIDRPRVLAILGAIEICDQVEAPGGSTLLRVSPNEVMLVGTDDADGVHADVPGAALVEAVSDGWTSFVLDGPDAPEAFARVSELGLPETGWLQGDVASAAAKVLGDRELWPKLRADLEEWLSSDDNEESLIPQWESCLLYDQTEQLPGCMVPMHVVAFSEDVQAPPQDNQELAEQAGNGMYHELEGMGHGSIYGHTHEVLNPFIRELVLRYLER